MEDLVDFLEPWKLGNTEEDNRSLDSAPDAEDDVRAPCDLFHRHQTGELVTKQSGVHGHILELHALDAHLEGKYLDGIYSLKECHPNRE